MCMNCGCGEPEKRHHPTDITREDMQRAADGSGITLRAAAQNMVRSTEELTRGRTADEPAESGRRA